MTAAETFTFETEARQILELMTHSVYSNREVFLRELISNSSDALDKLRFESVKDQELASGDAELHIRLEADSEARTLTISDNGIGMSREEVISNIGTIARSGTRQFLEALSDAKDSTLASPDLIGQFGVGFYSSFMVADRVVLLTRRAGSESTIRWESTGDGSYTLEELSEGGLEASGTSVCLFMKEVGADDTLPDFTTEWVLRQTIKKYSDFVAYPIRMDVERTESERDDEGKPIEGTEKTTVETETLNSMKAIWARDKSEVSDDEYNEFYRHICHDWTDPLSTIALKAEGTFEYKSVLFVPSKAPMDLFNPEFKSGLKLYVRRVFIMDDCKELLPEYLRFVRGVVDAEDLNLNISREILQQDRQVQAIRKHLVKKIIDTLKSMKLKEDDKYQTFWKEFGPVVKEGIYRDNDNKDKLLSLVMCHSTKGEERISLADYVDGMKSGQDAIYYMTGPSLEAGQNSPHLEAFKAKGYDVLFLVDPVDEIWVQYGTEFEGKKLQSVGKGNVELGTDEEKEQEKASLEEKSKTFEDLLKVLQTSLDEDLKEVRLSSRLTDSAACLVGDQGDLTPQMEQLMRAMGQEVPKVKRILEVNPGHPVLAKLKEKFDGNSDDPAIPRYAQLLHGQALLAEGTHLSDPGAFSKLVADLMVDALA